MEVLKEIGILVFGIRGLMYLESFVRNETLPNIVIIQGRSAFDIIKKYPGAFWTKFRDFFDISKDLEYYLSKFSLQSIQLENSDINSKELKDIISARNEQYFIFSGGGIIKQDLLRQGKHFIHIHPGILPEYRGSTCFYYSMLKENQCGASAFLMQKEIDGGKVIAQKLFNAPCIDKQDGAFFDLLFDPWIRAELLYEVIKSYKEKRNFKAQPQAPNKGQMYFVIHPVLKNLVMSKWIRPSL